MPKALSEVQVQAYHRDGFVHPVRIMPAEAALELRRKFEAVEAEIGGEAQNRFKIKAHLPFPWMGELIRNPVMLDAIEDLIGPNILCWGSSFFTKKARDPRFVSWHQDSTYYGIRPSETATAWFAFSDGTIEAGCLRVIPATHRDGLIDHEETRDGRNLLMRGQTIQGVDESKPVDVELRAGEISIHHERVVHGSNPNGSDDARIGLSIHYIAPHVRQTSYDGAMALLVRGEDSHGHWGAEPVPACDMDPACLAALDDMFGRYKSGIGKPD